jgi:hypothetical protein
MCRNYCVLACVYGGRISYEHTLIITNVALGHKYFILKAEQLA